MQNGKGSKRRPTDEKLYTENWDRLFKYKHLCEIQELTKSCGCWAEISVCCKIIEEGKCEEHG